MEATIYNTKGTEAGKLSLPESVFGLPWNADLVHQVVVSMQSTARNPIAHTKTRGEVRGGGKKPWKQKGTGRSRHGSSRSPIWVGGGVTHGPRNDKNYDRKVNRKMKAKALFTILSKKLKDGEVLFVDSFNFEKPKTTEALDVLKTLSGITGFEKLKGKKSNAAYIGVSSKNLAVNRSFSNIGSVMVDEVRNLNPLHLLQYKFVVITNPKESIDFLAGKIK